MLNSGVGALLIQLWRLKVYGVEKWRKEKKGWKGVEKQLKKKEKHSNEKEVKEDWKVQKLFKSWKFESEYSLIIMCKVHTYVEIYYLFLSSYMALFFHSPSIWPQNPKIHESLIQLCISHPCQNS